MADSGASITGKVYFSTGSQNIPANTTVSLVSGFNQSEFIPGFNVTADSDGFFKFLNVPYGVYNVYAWSPYYFEGYSAGINVTTDTTYTASVALIVMPYYADITASTQSVVKGNSADITAQILDYWGNPIGQGWQVTFHTTVGVMDPVTTFTDKDGKAYSSIPWVDNRTPAEITVYAKSTNGSYYPLEERSVEPSPTATPTASATPTATPTVEPSATPTATPTAIPSGNPTTTPGFELIAALAATGMALSIRRNK